MSLSLSSSLRLTLLPWIAALAVSFAGCADPEGAYEDFKDRYNTNQAQTEAGVQEAGPPCDLATSDDVKDPYLFALSAKLLPAKPIVCFGTVTMAQGANGPEVSFNLQPLRADDKKTPVGDPIVGGPFPVQPDGSFVADFGNIEVLGVANPISGSDLATTATITGGSGALCKPADFICGEVTGIVSKPLDNYDLKGSKFTFQRITDPQAPYPKAMIDCAGTTPP
jgi:hypothetical protein